MNQQFYSLANRIHTARKEVFRKEVFEEEAFAAEKEGLDDFTKRKYQQSVFEKIRKDKRRKRRKRLTAAAACIVMLAAATIVFSDEAGAAIGRISYSLSAALGLENDLAEYKEIVHTSVSDGGYIVTLQEAAAAPEKLAISYTVQREDGQPMSCGFEHAGFIDAGTCFDVREHLYINGRESLESSRCTLDFLDGEQKIIGGQISYNITDTDLTRENCYELKFTGGIGSWEFRFKADGSDMYADTKRMPLGDRYILPNGASITLDELAVNDLEQRITFHASGEDAVLPYAITLHAIDEKGRTAVFFVCEDEDGRGYMMNEEALENGRIAEDSKMVTVTLHAVEFSKTGPETEKGQILKGGPELMIPPVENASENGGAVVWELSALR